MPDRNLLIKPVSGLCNMQCSYCFYCDETGKRQRESYGLMSTETLEQIIKKALADSERECTFGFQGGEPTLRGLEFFQKAVELQKKYNRKSIRIHNAIQTNGYELGEKWIRFFKQNQFLVGISLDGDGFTHDLYRKGREEAGSFQRILSSVERLKGAGVAFNLLTVVTAQTAKRISKIYGFYKQRGYEYLQFIPCLNPVGEENERYGYTLTDKLYGQFLRTLFDLWYQDIKQGNYIHIQQFENYILMLHRQPPAVCGMSGVCTCQNIVEADGTVFPCDFYAMDEYRLGNINQESFDLLDRKRKELEFVEQSQNLPEACRSCRFLALCGNGCKRYRIAYNDRAAKNRFCHAYYEFFNYSIERLEELAAYYFHI